MYTHKQLVKKLRYVYLQNFAKKLMFYCLNVLSLIYTASYLLKTKLLFKRRKNDLLGTRPSVALAGRLWTQLN